MPLLPQLRLYWDSLRPRESLMMLGVPMLGILFAEPRVEAALLARSAVLLASGLLVAGHLYTLNDLFGLSYDVYDRHKSERPLLAHKLRARQIWLFSLSLGALGYGMVWLLDPTLFYLSFSLTLLWLLYSLPHGLKGYPVVTSAVNSLGAGIVPFLVGYLLAGTWSPLALLLSLYFGIIAGAGQMNREIIDMDADRAAGLTTTAVWLGRRRTFDASFALFVFSALYLFGLVLWSGRLPVGLGVAALLLQPFHYRAYRRCVAAGLGDRAAVVEYIKRYRALYAVLGGVYTLRLAGRLMP
jgi:lycopene elongase/hydratase (dihydrobisanhydrobacterioruberin-forming)